MILARAASIIHKDIFNSHGFYFNGSFPPGCQQESVSINLKYLVSMLHAQWTQLTGSRLNRITGLPHSIPDDHFQLQKGRSSTSKS